MTENPQTSDGKDSGGPTNPRFCPKCQQYAKLVSTETDLARSKYHLFVQEVWDCLACGAIRVTYWYDWRKRGGHP